MGKITLEHALMTQEEAVRFLGGNSVCMGERVMDPKAQIVAQFVQSIRVPGYFPSFGEMRRQLVRAVALLDAEAIEIAHKEEIKIPTKAGTVPGRVYVSQVQASKPLPVLLYYHGGGWVQGDLETHDGGCAPSRGT